MNIKQEYRTKLLDWYWQYGSRRQGTYALSRGGWLDRALRLVADHTAVERSMVKFSKPTMALWGPSQSGKSTLLARFIDAGSDERGVGGALSWDPACPARFSGNNQNGTVAVLNPYNQGADASGCVTRFVLQDAVPYPEYPVEVEFASQQDILLSLAVGYLSETTGMNKKGAEVHWAPEDMKEISQMATKGSIGTTPDKEAFLLLVSVLNVVDILIDMEFSRYINLSKEWKNRRSSLLSDDRLVSNVENVRKFAAELLWDSWDNMSAVCRMLCDRRASFGKGKRYFCSIEMAALMLNISAASYYRDSDYVRDLVDRCTLKELEPGVFAISKGSGRGDLFRSAEDFALVQGLVSLIIVPLRRDVMRASAPEVADLMERAELVDFPGVANEHKSAELLTDDKLALSYTGKDGKQPLFALTQVMKRGKTASIVVSSARNLNIDVFSLLVRMPAGTNYPAHPRQLMDGIRCWFKSMGQRTYPLSRDKKLKINLVLTFSATLLNLVHASGLGMIGLEGVFDKLRGMGDLASPEVVDTFCINYPQFPDGKIQMESREEKEQVIRQIMSDRHFRKQFVNTADSLSEMADLDGERYGGRIYLFRRMAEQLQTTQRPALLAAKAAAIAQEWDACMAEALPTGNSSDMQAQDIEKMLAALRSSDMSHKERAAQILSFENVEPDVLEVLPRRESRLAEYTRNQINLWMESAKRCPLQRGLGFENEEHRSRVIGYLAERLADGSELRDWLLEMGLPDDREESKERRRLVATYMVNKLFSGKSPHKPESACIAELCDLGNHDVATLEGELSPYYKNVVCPFIRTLEELKSSGGGRQRPKQPGDDELAALLANG